ncbi:sugar transferase [Globicatella sp. HMSC072A10]|uniref:sugar transferase n=1 Tax=Globicatella sp. HMSC072A10 TaxID=1739315 RepID=UPI0008CAF58F|nr:sugar transferase [Globicatella sp. HMSC072A10]OFK60932.1 UDP-phosphate galactose phosphotransferase [Globicatella sp. HMSC072A10]
MYKKYFKRAIDILVSLIFLPLILILILVVGILIKLDDGGSVFYFANRRGINGNPFNMVKFRSMKENSPDIRNEDGSTFNSENDPRITKIGKFLRKTSIDEIPQLINVLIGDMSLIGPRPNMATKQFDELSIGEQQRVRMKPGITGYSQAFYRNSISMDEKTKLDNYYIDNVSFLLDMKIILQTLKTVILKENINAN